MWLVDGAVWEYAVQRTPKSRTPFKPQRESSVSQSQFKRGGGALSDATAELTFHQPPECASSVRSAAFYDLFPRRQTLRAEQTGGAQPSPPRAREPPGPSLHLARGPLCGVGPSEAAGLGAWCRAGPQLQTSARPPSLPLGFVPGSSVREALRPSFPISSAPHPLLQGLKRERGESGRPSRGELKCERHSRQ